MDLDRQDKRILATLQQDGSVTNLELAEKSGCRHHLARAV